MDAAQMGFFHSRNYVVFLWARTLGIRTYLLITFYRSSPRRRYELSLSSYSFTLSSHNAALASSMPAVYGAPYTACGRADYK